MKIAGIVIAIILIVGLAGFTCYEVVRLVIDIINRKKNKNKKDIHKD